MKFNFSSLCGAGDGGGASELLGMLIDIEVELIVFGCEII